MKKQLKDHILITFLFFLALNIVQKVNSQSDSVRINEFMAINESVLTDEDGDYSDWIELYNTSATQTVYMEGWSLTDELTVPKKWIFPDVSIEPNGYMIIFASGKDKTSAGNELHTNFKLNGSGEYLALLNPANVIQTVFSPAFPEQISDFSYGIYDSAYVSFADPTPGTDNGNSVNAVLPSPEFSVNRGFFDSPFTLEINSEIAGANIIYTTDGSEPNTMNGIIYSLPIIIDSTTIIRAITSVSGNEPSDISTQTYLFIDDIIHQTNTPEGYPALWGPYTELTGNAVADYEMDPELISDSDFANQVKEALTDLPVISLVTNKDNLFSHEIDSVTGGIYIYTGPPDAPDDAYGFGWERPVSFEYFSFDDSISLQVNCGLRLHGGHSRRPEKSPKHSFRLVFKSKYGPSKLNFPFFGEDAASSFENIVLRAGFGNSWIHHSHEERARAQYLRDTWAKDTQREMGYFSSHVSYVHLYINGIYWGIYSPSERMDRNFAASYLEGDEDDFDVIKDYSEVVDGEKTAWNSLMSLANSGLEDNEAYQMVQGNNPDGSRNPEIQNLIDVENLIDYMLINFYGGNTDWDQHNWAAMRNRTSNKEGFKFFCWDAEHILKDVDQNALNKNNSGCPSRIFQKLRSNEDFLQFFANKVHKHCYYGGILTPEATAARWETRRDQIQSSLVAESARWGDYRRDIHQHQPYGPFDLYTVDDYWLPQQDFMLNTYFPQRTNTFLSQLRSAGLFPNTIAPDFEINNNPITQNIISDGDVLTMSAPLGTIYYTADGTNPAAQSSESVIQYTGPVTVTESMHLKARAYYNNEWSATSDVFLIIPSDYNDLRITEIHYHPLDEDTIDNSKFEFIEIKNTGSSTLDLGGIYFSQGINYIFPPETELGPQQFIVLSSDENYFYTRYNFVPFDNYDGQLNNSGELILLSSPFDDTLSLIRYSDGDGWPVTPDGDGYSLVPVELNPGINQNEPDEWRASLYVNGSPGRDDLLISPITEQIAPEVYYSLSQNYPNPFSDLTFIDYEIPETSHVQLIIYSLIGQHINTLVDQQQNAGHHQLIWNGTDGNNNKVDEGVYFYRLEVSNQNNIETITKKMMLIR